MTSIGRIIPCIVILGIANADDEENRESQYQIPDGKTIPAVEKIDDNKVSLGKVTINHADKSVSFPAVFNMQEGLVEYIVTLPHGKVHEALLLTEADPLHISLGMKLLQFTSFETFFPMRDANLEWLPFTEPKPEEYKDAYLQIKLSWKDGDKQKESDLSDIILQAKTKKGLSTNAWLYTNSFFYDSRYQASITGDVISIFADRSSPINYIGEFNDGINENGWLANKQALPPPGTPATVTITQKNAPAASTPTPKQSS